VRASETKRRIMLDVIVSPRKFNCADLLQQLTWLDYKLMLYRTLYGQFTTRRVYVYYEKVRVT
jgi:hypothetical protein